MDQRRDAPPGHFRVGGQVPGGIEDRRCHTTGVGGVAQAAARDDHRLAPGPQAREPAVQQLAQPIVAPKPSTEPRGVRRHRLLTKSGRKLRALDQGCMQRQGQFGAGQRLAHLALMGQTMGAGEIALQSADPGHNGAGLIEQGARQGSGFLGHATPSR